MTSLTEGMTTLELHLNSEKEAIVQELMELWSDMKRSFQREELCDSKQNGMQVRLIVTDGSWELHTGDVQFETTHEGFWGSGELNYDLEESEVVETMESLASELISGVLDEEAEADLDSYWQ